VNLSQFIRVHLASADPPQPAELLDLFVVALHERREDAAVCVLGALGAVKDGRPWEDWLRGARGAGRAALRRNTFKDRVLRAIDLDRAAAMVRGGQPDQIIMSPQRFNDLQDLLFHRDRAEQEIHRADRAFSSPQVVVNPHLSDSVAYMMRSPDIIRYDRDVRPPEFVAPDSSRVQDLYQAGLIPYQQALDMLQMPRPAPWFEREYLAHWPEEDEE